nr:MAG TPA: hypothetical protein [Caudoviricetes sp.]DAS53992.1 MAG TPA: hypothetical protein [Caudoviricetes sp.]
MSCHFFVPCILVSIDRLVGDRASTTNTRWRNLFP